MTADATSTKRERHDGRVGQHGEEEQAAPVASRHFSRRESGVFGKDRKFTKTIAFDPIAIVRMAKRMLPPNQSERDHTHARKGQVHRGARAGHSRVAVLCAATATGRRRR